MPELIAIDQLGSALALGPRSVVSLVGGGGKTTALFALGRQLSGTVLLSTTTKMGRERVEGFAPLIGASSAQLAAALERDRVVLAWKRAEGHRAVGYTAAEVAAWSGPADHVILEADGSRRRPFKAPAAHEPVVAASTTLLVACVGAAAFGAPIEQCCHRPDLVADLVGCGVADDLTPARLAMVLTSPRGSRKHCPPAARSVVLANQVAPADVGFIEELEGLLGDTPVVAVAAFRERRR